MFISFENPGFFQSKRSCLIVAFAILFNAGFDACFAFGDNQELHYPRPQFERSEWVNLNGNWDYAIVSDQETAAPEKWAGKIEVPFPIESASSGVQKPLLPGEALWYRLKFAMPEWAGDRRTILNFGAVDYQAEVFVNGKAVGSHKGGYTPFSFDITDLLTGSGEQELVVKVIDGTDTTLQPRGKQVLKPGDIFYSAVSGIWQTVWLEGVPENAIESLKIVPDIDKNLVSVTVKTPEEADVSIRVVVLGREVAKGEGKSNQPIEIEIPNPRLWTPNDPYLYDLKITSGKDEVESYFGMRKIAMAKDEKGINRIFLNNEPLFQLGVLDQGYWPGGLYTPPNDNALRYDVEMARQFGFNMIRKHMKVESARWYYWCDKLGMLVWQDFPCMMNAPEHFVHTGKEDLDFPEETVTQFRKEIMEMVDMLQGSPSVVVWIPFNEGWGQHRTNETSDWLKAYDPTRLVDGASGWVDRGGGEIKDWHKYGDQKMPPLEPNRAVVLGEYGGVGLLYPENSQAKAPFYSHYNATSNGALQGIYTRMMVPIYDLIGQGLAGAIYTQLTDVEHEVNGLLTFDRKVVKLDPMTIANINQRVINGTFSFSSEDLLPPSGKVLQKWKYTFKKPEGDWTAPNYDDSSWKTAPGGFGAGVNRFRAIGTFWPTREIWLRRTFELESVDKFHSPQLMVLHDEDAEVYVNGTKVLEAKGFTVHLEPMSLSADAIKAFRKGPNLIAAHCENSKGPQFFDLGIVDWNIPPIPEVAEPER